MDWCVYIRVLRIYEFVQCKISYPYIVSAPNNVTLWISDIINPRIKIFTTRMELMRARMEFLNISQNKPAQHHVLFIILVNVWKCSTKVGATFRSNINTNDIWWAIIMCFSLTKTMKYDYWCTFSRSGMPSIPNIFITMKPSSYINLPLKRLQSILACRTCMGISIYTSNSVTKCATKLFDDSYKKFLMQLRESTTIS